MASQGNLSVKFYKISCENRSDNYSRSKMSEVKRQITEIRNQARASEGIKTAKVIINGRECTIEAKAVSFLFFFKITEIAIKHTLLGSRHNIVSKFVCFMERGIDRKIKDAETKIKQIDEEIKEVEPFIATLKEIAGQEITIAEPPDSTPQASKSLLLQINGILVGMKSFVQQNDLSRREIASLRQSLRDLCSKPIIQFEGVAGSVFSINEIDHGNPHCLEIALKAEAIEILLDAKESGQVALEKNVPPDIEDLGKGSCNTIQLAHTGKGRQGPVALKPCDQSKMEANADEFARASQTQQEFIGRVGGSYGKNKATAKLQDMLVNIGRGEWIDVPRVVATVSAAEVNGTPCIAMEKLNGETVGQTDVNRKIKYDNKFVRRETWIQLQDILTGQIDRHGNNVILTKDGPVAIDHDLSFPTDPPRKFAATVPFQIAVRYVPNSGNYNLAVDGVSPRNSACLPS
jgi:hypothetical protein